MGAGSRPAGHFAPTEPMRHGPLGLHPTNRIKTLAVGISAIALVGALSACGESTETAKANFCDSLEAFARHHRDRPTSPGGAPGAEGLRRGTDPACQAARATEAALAAARAAPLASHCAVWS